MSIECFFVESTGRHKVYLKWYASPEDTGSPPCPLTKQGYHLAKIFFREQSSDTYSGWPHGEEPDCFCECGYKFKSDDDSEDEGESVPIEIFRRIDTGEELTFENFPPGAMFYADWWLKQCPHYAGPDGHCLVVRCSDGIDWTIDGRSSRCTMLADKTHKCWIRHGEVPRITVEGNSIGCGVGDGRFRSDKWSGYLRDGKLLQEEY